MPSAGVSFDAAASCSAESRGALAGSSACGRGRIRTRRTRVSPPAPPVTPALDDECPSYRPSFSLPAGGTWTETERQSRVDRNNQLGQATVSFPNGGDGREGREKETAEAIVAPRFEIYEGQRWRPNHQLETRNMLCPGCLFLDDGSSAHRIGDTLPEAVHDGAGFGATAGQ